MGWVGNRIKLRIKPFKENAPETGKDGLLGQFLNTLKLPGGTTGPVLELLQSWTLTDVRLEL